jgi:hypothetical protein
MPYPCLKVVTVNKVQTTYAVPIYNAPGGGVGDLNALCPSRSQQPVIGLDLEMYASEISLTVHVGNLHLLRGPGDGDATASVTAVVHNNVVDSTFLPNSPPTTEPVVSVIIPVHDSERYLTQCLLSLLQQPQHCLFEVILIDDGSTDRSLEIAQKIQEEVTGGSFESNPGVTMRVLRPGRVGLAAARDIGLLTACGELIARLDSDDLCEAGRLGKQVRFLEGNRGIYVVGGQAVLIGDDGDAVSAEMKVCMG